MRALAFVTVAVLLGVGLATACGGNDGDETKLWPAQGSWLDLGTADGGLPCERYFEGSQGPHDCVAFVELYPSRTACGVPSGPIPADLCTRLCGTSNVVCEQEEPDKRDQGINCTLMTSICTGCTISSQSELSDGCVRNLDVYPSLAACGATGAVLTPEDCTRICGHADEVCNYGGTDAFNQAVVVCSGTSASCEATHGVPQYDTGGH